MCDLWNTPCLFDLTAAWYTKKEMKTKQFNSNAKRSTLSILDRSPALPNAMTRRFCRVLLTARSKVINAVMNKQNWQRAAGEHNPEILVSISKKTSVFPKPWRQRIAVLNAAS
ncbi:hypothetical protein ACHAWO_003436 [Cyclotella atomus]|uniref:Uncharacterized protein n=1 Tax=Cyclotella atomus TaxID=382360 RepID=A0ABD3QFF1_9STRA